jgi:hypothetical protein
MSSDDQATQFTRQARARVDTYIAQNPEYSHEGVPQPGQGSTNRVLFCRRGDETVVFKVFCQPERKQRELFAYRHWQPTGLIPTLIADVDEITILTTFLDGVYLHQARGEPSYDRACYETGRAAGTLTQVPLSAAGCADFEARFYDGLGPLKAYLARIVELGRGIQARDPDFEDPTWRDNLDLIESQLSRLYAQPRVLYHQDASNLHVLDGRFIGFFDLEMCRVGCAAMQLASTLIIAVRDPSIWSPFRAGWEAATGAPLGSEQRRAALAGYSLLQWREISRYLSYDGTPGTGCSWASPADPVAYRASIKAAQNLLDIH